MKNQKQNGKKNREYFVYVEGKLVPVTKEVYEAYYQPNWRTYDFMRRHDQCTQNNWWSCGGDCGSCDYQLGGDSVSFEYLRENADFEIGVSNNDPANIVAGKMLVEDALAVADQIVSNGRCILELFLENKTDREMADILGIPRSTCNERKMKLFQELRKFFGIF